MRHLKKKKKLSMLSSHRDAVIINLCKSLIKHSRIKTTKAKAKMVQPLIEKMVTKAKNDSLHSKRIVARRLKSWEMIPKLFNLIGPKFKSRPGGYTRIIKLGFRKTDAAEMVQLEFLEEFKDITKEGEEKKAEKAKPKGGSTKNILDKIKDKKKV